MRPHQYLPVFPYLPTSYYDYENNKHRKPIGDTQIQTDCFVRRNSHRGKPVAKGRQIAFGK